MLKRSPLFSVQREVRDEEMGRKVKSVAVKGCGSRNQYWINEFKLNTCKVTGGVKILRAGVMKSWEEMKKKVT